MQWVTGNGPLLLKAFVLVSISQALVIHPFLFFNHLATANTTGFSGTLSLARKIPFFLSFLAKCPFYYLGKGCCMHGLRELKKLQFCADLGTFLVLSQAKLSENFRF